MVRQRIAALALLVFVLLLAMPVQAVDLGARAMGMGGAYAALANDAAAVYWNPAGLAEVSVVSVTPVVAVETTARGDLSNFQKLTGTESNVTLPTGDFTLGASGAGLAGIVTKRFGITYLPEATLSAEFLFRSDPPPEGAEPISGNGSKFSARASIYNDTVVSGALPLAKAPFGLGGVNVGANLKFIRGRHFSAEKTLEVTEPGQLGEPVRLNQDSTGNGFGLDLGAQGKLTDKIRFGVVARDLVNSVSWSGVVPEPRKPAFQAGVALKAPLGLTLAADLENAELGGDRATRLRLGLEESLFGILAVRAGYRTNPGANPSYSVGLGAGLGRFLRVEGALASDLDQQVQACLTAVAQF